MSRASRPWTKERPTAAQRRAQEREQALARCKQGDHQMSPTMRPGERVCLVCELVLYCPVCLQANRLSVAPGDRVYALPCLIHQQAEAGGRFS